MAAMSPESRKLLGTFLLGLVSSLLAGRIPARHVFLSALFLGLMVGIWVATFVMAGAMLLGAWSAQGVFQTFWASYPVFVAWIVLVAVLVAFLYLKALGLGYRMERRANEEESK